MKRILTATTALALALTGSLASAQDWHRGNGQYQNRGQGGDRGPDYRDGRRDERGHARRDDRRGDRRGNGRYARGERYRGDGAYISDYRRYGYRAPPRGYRYYRTNNGDVLLAAVATGIISSVILSRNNGY